MLQLYVEASPDLVVVAKDHMQNTLWHCAPLVRPKLAMVMVYYQENSARTTQWE